MKEWERQRKTYLSARRQSQLRLGFATFFLNRCNRSGIIVNGGPIGGKDQRGRWKIDARYNPDDLEKRIRKLAAYRDRISLSNLDAIDFLEQVKRLPAKEKPFVYLDPPYYAKGSGLYLNYYEPDDHKRLASYVKKATFPWVLSYDNVPEVRSLYAGLRQVPFALYYSAREWRIGSEVLILKRGLVFPDEWASAIPLQAITARDDGVRHVYGKPVSAGRRAKRSAAAKKASSEAKKARR